MKPITNLAAVALIATAFVFSSQTQAAMALAFSQSAPTNNNNAVVTNMATETDAKQWALEECKRTTGKNDCKIILSSDKPGYGAMYAACVSSDECFYTFATGYASNRAAHDYISAACKRDYGVESCYPWKDWQDSTKAERNKNPNSNIENPSRPTRKDYKDIDSAQPNIAQNQPIGRNNESAESTNEVHKQKLVDRKKSDSLNEMSFNDLLKLAKNDNGDAQYEISTRYMEGRGVKKDANVGSDWLVLSYLNNSFKAAEALCISSDKDKPDELEFCQKSAELGSATGKYLLADIYQKGKITKKDELKYKKLLLEAAQGGHTPAQFEAGYNFLFKKKGFENNLTEAIKWLGAAGENEESTAQLYLYHIYSGTLEETSGKIAKNDQLAIKWINRSAKNRNPLAQYQMFSLYSNAKYFPCDRQKAEEWLLSASESGSTEAVLQLGIAHHNGFIQKRGGSIKQDWKEAKRNLEIAKKYGEKSAGPILEEVINFRNKRIEIAKTINKMGGVGIKKNQGLFNEFFTLEGTVNEAGELGLLTDSDVKKVIEVNNKTYKDVYNKNTCLLL